MEHYLLPAALILTGVWMFMEKETNAKLVVRVLAAIALLLAGIVLF
jgi:hypothetical protein